MSGLTGQSKI